ncbi:hypothetical protein SELMODRAFT_129520 [Selaginella moellendorffii]|uniref:Protein kinase domain-containing protein n=1 Tax=Selaginella moellendorffii TaxID=88036 RepID=D8T0Z1_SELML|nr:hypothetical protein SELMODRAFT_129520 [Selaginella moellendorffii]
MPRYSIDYSTRLGRGTGGTVRGGINLDTMEKVAIKEMVEHLNLHEETKLVYGLLQECQHENIVKLLDVGSIGGKTYMVFEHMFGDLYKFKKRLGMLMKRTLNREEIKTIIEQILQALAYMHEHGIVHQDIKTANVLINKEGTKVKLCDFDHARRVTTPPRDPETIGTLAYNAPEIILGDTQELGSGVDVWGAGVILAELVLGYNPFSVVRESHAARELYRVVEEIKERLHREIGDEDILELLDNMLVWEPEERWSAERALSSSFFEDGTRQMCGDPYQQLTCKMATQCVI